MLFVGEKATSFSPILLSVMSPSETKPKALTVLLQISIVCLLVCQSCAYVLMRRYVQTQDMAPDSTLILLFGEIQKLLFSVAVIFFFDDECKKKKFSEFCAGGAVMCVLAIAYLTMNLLSYYSLKYISGSLFITIAQLKTFTTALFSVIILKSSLSNSKWFSLFLLVTGSIFVTQQEQSAHSTQHADHTQDASNGWYFFLGLSAVLLEVTISGLVSAFYEKILKNYNASVWERNVQLAFLSMIMYYMYYVFDHGPDAIQQITRWSWSTFLTATLGAAGGILVAMCMKYLNAIVKCVVLSFSVLVTVFLSHLIFDSPLGSVTMMGAVLVVCGSVVFNQADNIEALMQTWRTDQNNNK